MVLCVLILAILELSALVLSTLILRIGVLCVLVSLVLRRVSIILLLAVGHVAGIHGVHMLMVVMLLLLLLLVLGNKGRRRLPPTRRPGTADHIGAVNTSSSLYILPSRQMAVTHRAGLGIE
jgi:hypothetical protein